MGKKAPGAPPEHPNTRKLLGTFTAPSGLAIGELYSDRRIADPRHKGKGLAAGVWRYSTFHLLNCNAISLWLRHDGGLAGPLATCNPVHLVRCRGVDKRTESCAPGTFKLGEKSTCRCVPLFRSIHEISFGMGLTGSPGVSYCLQRPFSLQTLT